MRRDEIKQDERVKIACSLGFVEAGDVFAG
jgi:hypothetical protein